MGAGDVRHWFTFAAVGLLAAGVCRLRSRNQGLLAGAVLLGTKAFVMLGAAQYADVPLAFFILATVLLLGLDDAAEQSSPGLVLLAGFCAGLAAWTKNEGLLFLVVMLAARCLVAWRQNGGRHSDWPTCPIAGRGRAGAGGRDSFQTLLSHQQRFG